MRRDATSYGVSDPCASVFAQVLAQPREAREHAALDRAERLAEALGELGLGVAAVVGELDRLALLGRELPQGLADRLALGRELGFVGSRGAQRLSFRLQRLGPAPFLATHQVDRSAVHEREQPRAR